MVWLSQAEVGVACLSGNNGMLIKQRDEIDRIRALARFFHFKTTLYIKGLSAIQVLLAVFGFQIERPHLVKIYQEAVRNE